MIILSNISKADSFTNSIREQGGLSCHHCKQHGQWLPHGFLYKLNLNGQKRKTGKRIICDRRRGGRGCGRTLKIMVKKETHQLQVCIAEIAQFILALLKGLTLPEAYERATGTPQSRNAWRWWSRLKTLEGSIREDLFQLNNGELPRNIEKNGHENQLLTLLEQWMSSANPCPCEEFQVRKSTPLLQA